MQRKRLQSTQIELQRSIIFFLRATSILKLSISYRPTFLSIQNHSAPERISTRDMLRPSFGCQPKWFVDFMSILRIYPAHKINRPRDDCVTRQIKSARTNQNV